MGLLFGIIFKKSDSDKWADAMNSSAVALPSQPSSESLTAHWNQAGGRWTTNVEDDGEEGADGVTAIEVAGSRPDPADGKPDPAQPRGASRVDAMMVSIM